MASVLSLDSSCVILPHPLVNAYVDFMLTRRLGVWSPPVCESLTCSSMDLEQRH